MVCHNGLRILQATVSSCPNLTALPEWFEDLASLRSLTIYDCPNLTLLPLGFKLLTKLQHFSIQECPELEERCSQGSGEDWSKIAYVPHKYIGLHQVKQSGEASTSGCYSVQASSHRRRQFLELHPAIEAQQQPHHSVAGTTAQPHGYFDTVPVIEKIHSLAPLQPHLYEDPNLGPCDEQFERSQAGQKGANRQVRERDRADQMQISAIRTMSHSRATKGIDPWDKRRSRPQEEGSKTGTFTEFTIPIHQILAQVKDKPWVRRPPPLRGDPSRRNTSNYCAFHRKHGYYTKNCNAWKRHLEELVRDGHSIELSQRSPFSRLRTVMQLPRNLPKRSFGLTPF
ncbi:unnamed protein product [Prunus armeniaca]